MTIDRHIQCPVASCNYSGSVASVAGHVSGKKDAAHDWQTLGYDGANHFKASINQAATPYERIIECPVADCSYSNVPASVAAHVSGKKDSAHDWRRLEYTGSREFKREYASESSDSSSVTVLHMTDTHIGKRQGGYGKKKWPVDCKRGFERAIDVALSEKVNAVLHTGDIFHNDRHGISDAQMAFCRMQLQRLQEQAIPFYYIRGDHAQQEGRQRMKQLEDEGLARNLTCSPVVVDGKIPLYGVNNRPADWWEAPDWRPKRASGPAILALHQSMQPFTTPGYAECDLEILLKQFKQAGGTTPDVVALGHFHREIDCEVGGSRVICGGSTERLGAKRTAFTPYVGILQSDGGFLTYRKQELV